jgi:hypothetical protein
MKGSPDGCAVPVVEVESEPPPQPGRRTMIADATATEADHLILIL